MPRRKNDAKSSDTTAVPLRYDGQLSQMVVLRGSTDAGEYEPLSSCRGRRLGENGNPIWKQCHDLV